MEQTHNFDEIIERRNTDAKKWTTYGKDVIPMWIADTDFASPKPVVDAMIARAKHPIYGYPGLPDSYERAICKWQKKRFGWEAEHLWVEYTPAVIPAVVYAMKAFTNIGDKIVLQTPIYHPFLSVIPHNGRYIAANPLLKNEDGSWSIDWNNLEMNLSDKRTSMFLLCSPHNPTGKCYTREELEKIAKLCEKYHVFVVSDEIHSDIVYKGNKHIPFGSISSWTKNNSVVCINPSKTFNIAGFRAGAAIIPNQHNHDLFYNEMENLKACGRNIFGAIAVETAYNECDYYADQLVGYLEKNLHFVQEYLKSNIPKIKLGQVQATYLLWLDCRALDLTQQELNTFFLEKAKVALNDGSTFGREGEGYMRFNIACPHSQLVAALERIAAAIKKEGL